MLILTPHSLMLTPHSLIFTPHFHCVFSIIQHVSWYLIPRPAFCFVFTSVYTVTPATSMKDAVFFSSSIFSYSFLCVLINTGHILVYWWFMLHLCLSQIKELHVVDNFHGYTGRHKQWPQPRIMVLNKFIQIINTKYKSHSTLIASSQKHLVW